MIAVSCEANGAGPWPALQREHRPWTRWWWLGSAVDEANLTRELEELRDAGFGGVEITPVYGIVGAESRHVEFLSGRWLSLVLHACREAHRLGLGVDVVPGTGWRMGDARVPRGERAVVLSLRKKGTLQGLRYSAIAAASGERVKRPAPGGGGWVIDVLDRDAVANYLRRFEDRFFSSIPPSLVRAQFHDSWEYDADWSHRFVDEFRDRRGYDLQPYLAAFDEDGSDLPDDVAARVRFDYRIAMEEMLLESFLQTWAHGCRDRGLLIRNQAHGSIGNLLDIYAAADIPETEIFSDRVDPLINKFASSAAHVAGRRLVSSESFTWLSDHWLTDLGKMKRYADYLFLRGINHIFYHGTAYSPDDAEWPGWLFYASTQVNNRNPIWRDLPALNAYIARCQSYLQAGSPDNDVLVYWPVNDGYMSAGGRVHKFAIHGRDWPAAHEFMRTAGLLWDKGCLFDYVSDRQLQQASAAEGGVLLPGGTYRALVLPSFRYVPVETAQALQRLAQAGIPIIYHGQRIDWDVPGLHNLEGRRALLRDIAERFAAGASFVPTDCPDQALVSAGVPPESFQAQTGLRCVRRKLERCRTLYFIVNPQAEPFDGWVKLGTSGTSAMLLDAWTGRSGIAQVQADRGIRLRLDACQSVIVIVADAELEGKPWAYPTPQEGGASLIPGPWRISFVAGGPTLPPPLTRDDLVPITELGVAELVCFAGTVRYETFFELGSGEQAQRMIDLGDVRFSARVYLNTVELGTRVMPPYTLAVPPHLLKPKHNQLVVEVTTLASNRIRDLDRRGVPWKVFHDINFVNVNYEPFDASGWDIMQFGLLGPVRLLSLQ